MHIFPLSNGYNSNLVGQRSIITSDIRSVLDQRAEKNLKIVEKDQLYYL